MKNSSSENSGFIIHLRLTCNNIETLFNPNYRIFYPTNPTTLDSETGAEIKYTYTDLENTSYGYNVAAEEKKKYPFLKTEFESDGLSKYMGLSPINPDNFVADEHINIIFKGGYRCKLSPALLQDFKIIFVDTYVKYCNGEKWQDEDSEGADLYFFPAKNVMFMANFIINNEANPYAQYIRKAIRYQGFNAVFSEFKSNDKSGKEELLEDGLEDTASEDEKKLFSHETRWFERSILDDIPVGNVQYALYMLWDCNNNIFYVGKAKDLRTRLNQHMNSSSDPTANFTHFRYGILEERYRHLIYMFEMHEIHTAGWILSTPKAKNHYLQSLPNCKCRICDVSMVNTVDAYHSPDFS